MKLFKLCFIFIALVLATSTFACGINNYCFKYVSSSGQHLDVAGKLQFYNVSNGSAEFIGAGGFNGTMIAVAQADIKAYHDGESSEANAVKIAPALINGQNARGVESCTGNVLLGKTVLGSTTTFMVHVNDNHLSCSPLKKS